MITRCRVGAIYIRLQKLKLQKDAKMYKEKIGIITNWKDTMKENFVFDDWITSDCFPDNEKRRKSIKPDNIHSTISYVRSYWVGNASKYRNYKNSQKSLN